MIDCPLTLSKTRNRREIEKLNTSSRINSRILIALVSSILALFVSGCSTENNQGESEILEDRATVLEYEAIEWTDLIPLDDLKALMNPPDYLSDILDGSETDQIDSMMQSDFDEAPQSDYEKALVSTAVVPEFNDRNVKLPGFIVPIEFNDDLIVSEFFLVPYFGACLHSPPPPPNQIVYVKLKDGFKLESLQQPFWVSGLLVTEDNENDIARSAYSISAQSVTPYL